ncbi:MAG: ROK family protein [Bacteroidales bacterium]|nr:ROK family protein [Bacteroidales bacterium]
MKDIYVLGVDIGGTGTKIGLVNSKGEIISQTSIKTKSYPTIENFVDDVFAKADILAEGRKISGIGIGAPNGNYYNGCIENAPNLPWRGKIELAKLFEDKRGVKTLVTNDANAAAIGEMIFGAAKGIEHFIYITLGTGVGSGIVSGGEMIYGHDGMAGELGHAISVQNGRQCGCGRKGCLEMYASIRGIVITMQELIAENPHASKLENIENFNSKQIYEAAINGDKLALKAFDKTAEILGLALANAVAFSSPSHIFIFGGLANSGEILLKPLRKYFEENLLNVYQNKVKIELSALPDSDAAILGSAALILNEL